MKVALAGTFITEASLAGTFITEASLAGSTDFYIGRGAQLDFSDKYNSMHIATVGA